MTYKEKKKVERDQSEASSYKMTLQILTDNNACPHHAALKIIFKVFWIQATLVSIHSLLTHDLTCRLEQKRGYLTNQERTSNLKCESIQGQSNYHSFGNM